MFKTLKATNNTHSGSGALLCLAPFQPRSCRNDSIEDFLITYHVVTGVSRCNCGVCGSFLYRLHRYRKYGINIANLVFNVSVEAECGGN